MRQAVQARAPRFGIWPGDPLEAVGDSSIRGCGIWTWWLDDVLRRLEGITELGNAEFVGDNDMEGGTRGTLENGTSGGSHPSVL